MADSGKIAGNKSFDFSVVEIFHHEISNKVPFTGRTACYKPGTCYPYNMHYGLEFGIVLNGAMDMCFPGLKIHLSAGNVWFCGMWEPHGAVVGRLPCEQAHLIIWPPALACLRFDEAAQFNWLAPFTVPPVHRPQTNATTRPAMIDLGVKIRDCLKNKGEQIWLRMFLLEAIILASRQWSGPLPLNQVSAGQAAQFNQVLRYFFDNHGKITTSEAAGMCRMNRHAFSRTFQNFMGLPFADFALRYRLSSAASCLRQTSESIKSIALFWGFTDTSHFDRLFSRYYACAPYEYRHHATATDDPPEIRQCLSAKRKMNWPK